MKYDGQTGLWEGVIGQGGLDVSTTLMGSAHAHIRRPGSTFTLAGTHVRTTLTGWPRAHRTTLMGWAH